MRKSVLVQIHGNLDEWRAATTESVGSPRLPIPFAIARGLPTNGLDLIAHDLVDLACRTQPTPFKHHYPKREFRLAKDAADYALLWGTTGLRSCLSDSATLGGKRKTLLLCYGWEPLGKAALSRQIALRLTRRIARSARAVVLMTREQCAQARNELPADVPVVRMPVGIDTRFYRIPCRDEDVPDEHRPTVEQLLQEPYVVMPGDELRLNEDAFAMVKLTGLRLVRISQYRKGRNHLVRQRAGQLGLGDRVVVFERISYRFLRFLLQNAAGYAGLVDSVWQPAGWTAACECIASGLPLVLYEGLTSRELLALGYSGPLEIAPHGDVRSFAESLSDAVFSKRCEKSSAGRFEFAFSKLDCEGTSAEFGSGLAKALASTE